MSQMLTLRTPELLHITDGHRGLQYGASQAWYPSLIKRMSGCGPTTCSNLLWYLAGSRAQCATLCTPDNTSRGPILQLMKRIWAYVTPGMQGVHNTDIFAGGAARYAEDCGVPLSARVLGVPGQAALRPSWQATARFLSAAIGENLPVAFLNLSNGKVDNLESWHWVTLVGVDAGGGTAQMYDQGKRQDIDLQAWLPTTAMGGGFVVLAP